MLHPVIGVLAYLAYAFTAIFALTLLLRTYTRAPLEVVRKAQHLAFAMSVFLLLGLFDHWAAAAGASLSLALLAYPVLAWWEGRPSYRRLLTDRRPNGGEVRRQLLYAQLSFAGLVTVFWGGLGPEWKPLIAAAAMIWGFGDAAAALVGKAVGRRRLLHRAIEGAKTIEGTAAMVAAGAIAAFFTLLFYGGMPWWVSLGAAALVAPFAGVVELFSRKGIDTLTVPIASAVALVPWWLLAAVVTR